MSGHGHGHVTPNADGSKARCGGPGLCPICSHEVADKRRAADQAIAVGDAGEDGVRITRIATMTPDGYIYHPTLPDDPPRAWRTDGHWYPDSHPLAERLLALDAENARLRAILEGGAHA